MINSTKSLALLALIHLPMLVSPHRLVQSATNLSPSAPESQSQRPDYALRPISSIATFEQRFKEAISTRPMIEPRFLSRSHSQKTLEYSTTNTQEQDVDEPDKIKFNGRFLFTLKGDRESFYRHPLQSCLPENCSQPTKNLPKVPEVLIYDIDHAPLNKLLAPKHSVQFEQAIPQGLLLTNRGFVVYLSKQEPQKTILPRAQTPDRTELQFYDYDGITAPKLTHRLDFQGSFIHLRKINNRIQLTLSFWPKPQEMNPYNSIEQRKATVAKLPLAELLPQVRINQRQQPLVNPKDCLQQRNDKLIEGVNLFIQINTESLSTESLCVLANKPTLYTSPNYSYWIFNRHLYQQQSVPRLLIHQFGQEANSNSWYTGSLQVTGWITGLRPSFRLSEYNNHLRIVVNQKNNQHRLFIFKTEANNFQLSKVATLPNTQQPTPIGKPGEQIHSIRYQGPWAYIVTFKRIDPLYKLNLKDPQNPMIAGELEIPGYSDYLHHLPNNLLLGTGYDVDNNTRITNAKLALFDIEAKKPKLIKTFSIKTKHLGLTQNHLSLSCLTQQTVVRCALPFTNLQGSWSWQGFSIQIDKRTFKLNKQVSTDELKLNFRPYWLRSVIYNNKWVLVAQGSVIIKSWNAQ